MVLQLLDTKLQHEDLSMLTDKYPVKLLIMNNIPISFDFKKSLILVKSYDRRFLEEFINVIKSDYKHVKHVEVLKKSYSRGFGYTTYLETINTLKGSITELMLKYNVYDFREIISDGLEHWIILTSETGGRQVLNSLEDRAIIISVRRIKADETLKIMGESILSNDELKILKAAYRMGYFNKTRYGTARNIAMTLGISKSTFIKDIRRILKKLIMKELYYEYSL